MGNAVREMGIDDMKTVYEVASEKALAMTEGEKTLAMTEGEKPLAMTRAEIPASLDLKRMSRRDLKGLKMVIHERIARLCDDRETLYDQLAKVNGELDRRVNDAAIYSRQSAKSSTGIPACELFADVTQTRMSVPQSAVSNRQIAN